MKFQWISGREHFDPAHHRIRGGRNFYLRPNAGVKIGVWQILPKTIAIANHPSPQTESEWEIALRENVHPIVIYFHGNMGNRATGHRIDLYRRFQDSDFHVIAFDYRGFGDSYAPVHLTESGLVADSKFVYEWVLDNLGLSSKKGRHKIYFWGHSLGTGVAVHLVSDLCADGLLPKPSGLVLEAPFTNMTDEAISSMGAILYRPFSWGTKYFLGPKLLVNDLAFQSDRHIQQISIPILILHARLDIVVPFSHGEKLYDLAVKSRTEDRDKVVFKIYEGKDGGSAHVLIWQEPDLMETFVSFTGLCPMIS